MEARSFFENSPMAEVTVSATPEEWRKVIDDLVRMEPEDVSPETMELFLSLDRMGLV